MPANEAYPVMAEASQTGTRWFNKPTKMERNL